MSETALVGIAWFEAEDYDQLRAGFDDGDKLQDTYQEWLEDAQRVFENVQLAGHRAEKVPIRLAEFSLWCQIKGIPMDASARSMYASEAVRMGRPDTH